MKLTVQIGESRVDYQIRVTRAPREYDGMGTFTIMDGLPDDSRLVAIRDEHYMWQQSRNLSGMFATNEPEGIDKQEVINALWARLWRGNERGVQTCQV